jgi:hypothetical protein
MLHRNIILSKEPRFERSIDCYANEVKDKEGRVTIRLNPIDGPIGLTISQAKELRDFLTESIAKFSPEPTA